MINGKFGRQAIVGTATTAVVVLVGVGAAAGVAAPVTQTATPAPFPAGQQLLRAQVTPLPHKPTPLLPAVDPQTIPTPALTTPPRIARTQILGAFVPGRGGYDRIDRK